MVSETHEVTNQPPPLEDYDLFAEDRVLREAVEREGAAWAEPALYALAELAGSAEAQRWGVQANANPPVLRTHDRYGHRVDEVEYHPAYHELMEVAIGSGLHAEPWVDDRKGAHVARAAKMILWSQVDAGHTCPISMTYSVIPALRHQPELASIWEPRLTACTYDAARLPVSEKQGVTCGMALTEKQSGSDVRTNTTRATPANGGGPGAEYRITGHKWFCSAPMSDGFLVLAQAPGGLSCFLLPRILPDGKRNVFRIQQLKDKLGDRSNASSEVELDDSVAWLVDEEGRGVSTIIEMVNRTRLDCALGSAAIMRQGVAQATHHTTYREAFGKTLVDQPLMENVLADLAVESEAATAAVMRLAGAYDRGDRGDEHERLLARLATPVVKYWVCKRAPAHVAEALECLGGNGYVEESMMPRLFRQSPLNGVWEGSGNVICLDVLRAMVRSPQSVEAFLTELDGAAGADARYDNAVAQLRGDLEDLTDLESRARRLVEQMALCFQAALLVRHAPAAVADAFCASRLGGQGGRAFGTSPAGTDHAAIIERHRPSASS